MPPRCPVGCWYPVERVRARPRPRRSASPSAALSKLRSDEGIGDPMCADRILEVSGVTDQCPSGPVCGTQDSSGYPVHLAVRRPGRCRGAVRSSARRSAISAAVGAGEVAPCLTVESLGRHSDPDTSESVVGGDHTERPPAGRVVVLDHIRGKAGPVADDERGCRGVLEPGSLRPPRPPPVSGHHRRPRRSAP